MSEECEFCTEYWIFEHVFNGETLYLCGKCTKQLQAYIEKRKLMKRNKS